MIALPATKKTPQELELRGADVTNPTLTKGSNTVMLAHTTDNRSAHLRRVRLAWWTIAALTALLVLLADNEIVTACALWTAFVVVTRLEVVDRRRARRAAHRASLAEQAAIREAVALANAGHRTVEAVAA